MSSLYNQLSYIIPYFCLQRLFYYGFVMWMLMRGRWVLDFDVVFIGAGPGGYTGAIKASQLGLKTAIVEKEKTLGGTCLNVGCIPSKALLDSSEHFAFMKEEASRHGIQVTYQLDLPTMMKRKCDIVRELTKGIAFLMKKNKVHVFSGVGKITAPQKVDVLSTEGKTKTLTTKSIVIASGSTPIDLPFLKFNGQTVISSTEALSLTNVPQHLLVIGGGAVGLEMASVWLRLGAKVTVIEATSEICGGMDEALSKGLKKVLIQQGMQILTGTKVVGADVDEKQVTLNVESPKGQDSLTGDVCLVAIGRKPYTEGLDVQCSPRGQIQVGDDFQTHVPGVYAIGDVIDGPMLAHKAEEEGVAVAEIIAHKKAYVNYFTLPNVIYTWPEVASVGHTEKALKEKGIAYNKGQFPFVANGRAKAIGETNGFVKFLADQKTDRILGCHILGPRASDVLAEAVVAMEFSATSQDIGKSFHAHPTLSEVMREAALDVTKQARQF